MYLCIAPLSRFYYPETRRFINAFYYYYYYNALSGSKQHYASLLGRCENGALFRSRLYYAFPEPYMSFCNAFRRNVMLKQH